MEGIESTQIVLETSTHEACSVEVKGVGRTLSIGPTLYVSQKPSHGLGGFGQSSCLDSIVIYPSNKHLACYQVEYICLLTLSPSGHGIYAVDF